jgi:hypothetical protein
MAATIIVHHSCCGEAAKAGGVSQKGAGYLVHADGTIVKPANGFFPAPGAGEAVHVILLGYFNSNKRISAIDTRQLSSLTELLRQLLRPGDDFFRQLLFHHRYCPGFKFPWEELEWRLWNMLA